MEDEAKMITRAEAERWIGNVIEVNILHKFMSKVSIVIPSRNERFLVPTVKDIFAKAIGEIEIIAVLDGGEWPNPEPLPERDNLIVIRHAESKGTRAAINAGVAVASGEFILKSDGHCLFDEGFDEKLKANCEENWVVVPRRKRLDGEAWAVEQTTKPDIDYERMCWHYTDFGGWDHNIKPWDERNSDESLKSILLDDLMCFQASAYFMRREYFFALDLMDESTYGPVANEGEEIAFKCWTSGGRVVINKTTWYAHLRKGKKWGRGYELKRSLVDLGAVGVRKWLTDEAWPGGKQILPFRWLIDKFNPPGWPPEWPALVKAPRIAAPTIPIERPNAEAIQILRPSTLEYILGKFNLDTKADYSKTLMPIGLRMNRRELAELFAEMGFTVGAEIGTSEGKYAETLCKANPELDLYCIDPWQAYDDYRDYRNQSTIDDLLESARKRLATHLSSENRIVLTPSEKSLPAPPYLAREVGERRAGVHLVKAFSSYAAKCFEDGSLDFIYIDANHRFEYVVADIAAWLPKLKSQGVIAGHDFSHPKGKQFGVVEAVTGWTTAYGIAPWFVCKGEYEATGDRSHSWFWVKP